MAVSGELSAISLSKTSPLISPLSRISSTLPVSLSSRFIHRRISIGTCLTKPSLNLHFRASVLRSPSPGNEVDGGFEDEYEEFVDYEGYETEEGDESYVVDEEELEAEAEVAVQEYSHFLSRELRIG